MENIKCFDAQVFCFSVGDWCVLVCVDEQWTLKINVNLFKKKSIYLQVTAYVAFCVSDPNVLSPVLNNLFLTTIHITWYFLSAKDPLWWFMIYMKLFILSTFNYKTFFYFMVIIFFKELCLFIYKLIIFGDIYHLDLSTNFMFS